MLVAQALESLVRIDSQDFRKLSAGAQVMVARGGSWLCPKVEFLVPAEDRLILSGTK